MNPLKMGSKKPRCSVVIAGCLSKSGRLLVAVFLLLTEDQIIDIGRIGHLRPNMQCKFLHFQITSLNLIYLDYLFVVLFHLV